MHGGASLANELCKILVAAATAAAPSVSLMLSKYSCRMEGAESRGTEEARLSLQMGKPGSHRV